MRMATSLALALLLLASLFLPATVEAADRPRVLIAGFSSRVAKTDITMTDIDVPLSPMLTVARDELFEGLSGGERYTLLDLGNDVVRKRLDEPALLSALGQGSVPPELAPIADYIIYGSLTTLSNVKAQSGVLVFSGKDRTVYAELSLQVYDTQTGSVVFLTKADSRRKSELTYHAIVSRKDLGVEDAITQALLDAADNLAANVRAAI